MSTMHDCLHALRFLQQHRVRQSQHENRKLREVAEELVRSKLRPRG